MFCCFLFMAIIAGYMIVGVLAWLYGDPRHVLYPRNSTGMFCGIGQNKGKPSVFYFDLLKCATATNVMAAALHGLQCPTTQVCVESCSRDFWVLPTAAEAPGAKAKDFFQQKYCVPSFDLSTTNLTATEIVQKELCPSFYIPSSPVLGRCLPSVSSLQNIPSTFTLPGMTSVNKTAKALKNATSDVLSGFNAKHIEVKIFEDFASSWYWILIGLLIAMLLSLIFLLLLRFVAPILVWLLIVGVLGVVAYGIWHCYREHSYRDITMTIGNLTFSSHFSAFLDVRETWLAFMIILCIVEAILLLIVIFLRSRIVLAIALFQESSKALRHMLSTLLYPIVTFLLLVVYLATSGAPIYKVVALSYSSNCQAIKGTETCDPLSFNSSAYAPCTSARCIFIRYNEEGLFQQNLFNLQIYNVLAFLWCVNFVIALGQCTLAGAFASYYWAFSKPSDIPTFPLSQAFIRSLRYHVGSLAFGALILTIGQVCRILLEYLNSKFGAPQNPFTRFIGCCLKCCFWTLDKFIKFLNRNAYIMIAIYGKNFCVSAKNAFRLLMRNIIRVVVLDKVTDLLLLFCKILVVAGVGVLAFFFFSGRIPLPGNTFQNEALNFYWVPIITVIVGAYLIAQGFFSVYSMCVDTLFLCFLEDLERNDGTIQKPYYMSKNLLRILLKMNDDPKRGK
ncbi:choline transporter-like protein 4-like [Scleropages formosus]|uniref:Choline transporter-like protein n=1 Tax=Scleropages formosus TaxID=113540 RepID=A0A0P7WCS9_SCLFO|nr:choline transporter-like protein 4-like [Scleropages formosus]